MQADIVTLPTATQRQSGFLEKMLAAIPSSRWITKRSDLAKAYNDCPRVRMILSRNKDKFGVDFDDLKQDVWVVFERKMLPILDNPSNVYSVLYRCSELCARSLVNSRKELPLHVEHGEDVDEVASRMLEASDDGDADMAQAVMDDMDTQKARDIVRSKLEKFGWPADIPREASAYRRAGRPTKESQLLRLATDEDEEMKLKSILAAQLPTTQVDTTVSAAALKLATMRERDPRDLLQPMARELYNIRTAMHIPAQDFADMLGAKLDSIRPLLYGTYINEDTSARLVKIGKKKLAELRRDPSVKRALDTDATVLIKHWCRLLGMPDNADSVREIANLSGKKFSTVYRWYRENRKPVDIRDLAAIDVLVRQIAEKQKQKTGKPTAK